MLTGCVREIVTRAAARGELAPDADIDLLFQLPLSLLQNWRLEHAGHPGDDVDGRPYHRLRRPLWQVGAMPESGAIHPGRSARGHLARARARQRDTVPPRR